MPAGRHDDHPLAYRAMGCPCLEINRAGTIRHQPSHRFASAETALAAARNVRRLISEGFKPLEQLAGDLCPLSVSAR